MWLNINGIATLVATITAGPVEFPAQIRKTNEEQLGTLRAFRTPSWLFLLVFCFFDSQNNIFHSKG